MSLSKFVRRHNRARGSGGGHVSGQAGWWHFGLGPVEETELRVIWPDGTEGEWQRVEAGHFYIVHRDGAAETWAPVEGG